MSIRDFDSEPIGAEALVAGIETALENAIARRWPEARGRAELSISASPDFGDLSSPVPLRIASALRAPVDALCEALRADLSSLTGVTTEALRGRLNFRLGSLAGATKEPFSRWRARGHHEIWVLSPARELGRIAVLRIAAAALFNAFLGEASGMECSLVANGKDVPLRVGGAPNLGALVDALTGGVGTELSSFAASHDRLQGDGRTGTLWLTPHATDPKSIRSFFEAAPALDRKLVLRSPAREWLSGNEDEGWARYRPGTTHAEILYLASAPVAADLVPDGFTISESDNVSWLCGSVRTRLAAILAPRLETYASQETFNPRVNRELWIALAFLALAERSAILEGDTQRYLAIVRQSCDHAMVLANNPGIRRRLADGTASGEDERAVEFAALTLRMLAHPLLAI